MEQLQQQLPQQHSRQQFMPHPQLPMAILMQGSGPNSIDPAAAGGESPHVKVPKQHTARILSAVC
jgi:hypothetical protein